MQNKRKERKSFLGIIMNIISSNRRLIELVILIQLGLMSRAMHYGNRSKISILRFSHIFIWGESEKRTRRQAHAFHAVDYAYISPSARSIEFLFIELSLLYTQFCVQTKLFFNSINRCF